MTLRRIVARSRGRGGAVAAAVAVAAATGDDEEAAVADGEEALGPVSRDGEGTMGDGQRVFFDKAVRLTCKPSLPTLPFSGTRRCVRWRVRWRRVRWGF